MTSLEIYPIRFEPIYRSYLWGGNSIYQTYGRIVPYDCCAESWEIADRVDGMSVVANGFWKGHTLRDLMLQWGKVLLGTQSTYSRFPLLIKLIDAKENLSIQVHPDKKVAALLGSEPKEEAWVMLRESPVYAGLKPHVSQEHLYKAIHSHNIDLAIERKVIPRGDALLIPAGQVHALCAGGFALEIQQNSNTTYRIYDWGRCRELHIEQAMQAIHWQNAPASAPQPIAYEKTERYITRRLITSSYFCIDQIDIFDFCSPTLSQKKFKILFIISGTPTITVNDYQENCASGTTYLIPAMTSFLHIKGPCQCIHIFIPAPLQKHPREPE